MAKDLRKPVLVALAITIFSIVTASGQFDSNKAKKIASARVLTELERKARPPSRRLPPKAAGDLPFQQRVIIYYNAPKKETAFNDPGVKPYTKKGQPAIAAYQARPPVRQDPIQPILIYYKTYRPIASVGSSGNGRTEPKSKTAARFSPVNQVAAEGANIASFIVQRAIEMSDPLPAVSNVVTGSGLSSNASPGPIQPDQQPAGGVEIAPVSKTKEGLETSIPSVTERAASSMDSKPDGPVQRANGSSPEVATMQAISSPVSAAADLTTDKSSSPSTGSVPADRDVVTAEAVALNNSAVQLTSEHRYSEARALLERAVSSQPNVGKLHRNLSIVYENMKMTNEALASARTAEHLSPDDPSVVEQRCGMELEMGEPAVALSCYERLNSIRPLDGLGQTYLGIAMFKAGKADEAIAMLEKVANLKPPIPVAINALGVVYFDRKRFKDAAAAFKNAVETAPDMLQSRYNLAITQLSLKNKAGAISQYNILKIEDPELAAQLYNTMFSDKIVVVPKN